MRTKIVTRTKRMMKARWMIKETKLEGSVLDVGMEARRFGVVEDRRLVC